MLSCLPFANTRVLINLKGSRASCKVLKRSGLFSIKFEGRGKVLENDFGSSESRELTGHHVVAE